MAIFYLQYGLGKQTGMPRQTDNEAEQVCQPVPLVLLRFLF
jgi:hypothetical protein